jgi:hypothetical protein
MLYLEYRKTNLKDSSSNQFFILKYGEEEGNKRFKIKSEACANTLENFIIKHGKEVGTALYKDKNKRCTISLENLISKYGEEEGNKRWADFKVKNAGNKTIERFISKYGEELGRIKFEDMKSHEKFKSTLPYYINKHGEEEGTKLYNDKISKLHYGASLEGFKEKYPDDWEERFRASKDNTSLKSNIQRHGEEKGIEMYNKLIHKAKYTVSLQYYLDKYGDEEGVEKYYKVKESQQNGKFTSKISQELFRCIHEHLCRDHVYFSDLNKEYLLVDRDITRSCYFYDYVNITRNKCIEFNGDIWHANPDIYEPNDKPNPFTDKTAAEIWVSDEIKIQTLKKHRNIDTKIVWEKDYIKNKDVIIQECIEWLTS